MSTAATGTGPTAAGPARADLTPRSLARALGLHEPTREQARVIAHPLTPLLVVAGAGSGKTATMSQRVVHLVATGRVRPDQVLGLTFTRKATAELAQRVRARLTQLAGSGLLEPDALGTDQPEPTVATYDSFAGALVREHGLRIGADPDATLITEARAWKVVTGLIEARTAALPVETLSTATALVLGLDSALSQNLLSIEEAAEQMGELEELFTAAGAVRGLSGLKEYATAMAERIGLLEVVQAYRDHKRRHSLLSFGDQLVLACRIAQEAPDVAASVRQQYPAVLLDEFQDTSVAQSILLSRLFRGCGVTAVGDPNQAIYGWRGASAGALDTFHEHFNPAGAAARAAGAEPDEVAPVLPLSTAWRNDLAVLRAANVVSGPLRAHDAEDAPPAHGAPPAVVRVPVEPLSPRPAAAGLAEGQVLAAYLADPLAEADVVADFLAERWTPEAELAVLSRTRDALGVVAEALADRSVPHVVVGLGGMLTIPEVADVRALLTVAADPERGDRLMRLLTAGGIGAADLRALHRYARTLARGPVSGGPAPDDEQEPDAPLLAEALEAVARRADARPDGVDGVEVDGLSPAATRLADATARRLRRVREALGLPVPELVVLAEQVLGLDIEVTARLNDPVNRRALDALRASAEQFTTDVEGAGLADFLEWLDLADDHERSLPEPEVEPEPGAVQLMTIHAAKGLEWDAVAVIGLNEGNLPSYRSQPRQDLSVSTQGWLKDRAELPHPLRVDAATLPAFELGALEPPDIDKDQVKDMLSDYLLALGRHTVAEERRLAYVAVTRARHDVLLTGSHLAKRATRPKPMSRFLAELRRRDLVTPYGPGFTELDPEARNLLVERSTTVLWPADDEQPGQRNRAERRARRLAAAEVSAAQARARQPGTAATGVSDPADSPDPLVARWAEEARLLLAERDNRAARVPELRLPGHLAATSLDRLRTEPAAFATDLRRPLPQQPQAAGRLGTLFHDAVAQRLAAQTSLLTLGEVGVPDALDADGRAQLERWLATAEALPLLRGWSLAETEVERELTVGATTLRCRIDAVFRRDGARDDEEGAWLVVDWKTGRLHVPVDQLSVYVHAWALSLNVPTSAVRAAYVYVDPEGGEVDELTGSQLLGLDEIARVLAPS